MRFNVNLATHPYEDAGAFYRRWTAILLVAAIVTIIMAWLTWSNLRSTAAIRSEIARINGELATLQQEKRQAEAILNREDNVPLRDRSRYVNTLLARKQFSWTQVLQDLEDIVPRKVQIASIQPQFNAKGQLELNLRVQAGSRENALELVQRMEDSQAFRQAELRGESVQGGEDATVEFLIVALYTPGRKG